MKLQWTRGTGDGYGVASRCGRFVLDPQPEGTTRTVSYLARDTKTGNRWTADNQRTAKYDAQKIVDRENSTTTAR